MSKEVIDALASGEMDPLTYWVFHASSWRNIAEEAPLDDVADMYGELKESALDVAEFLVFNATPSKTVAAVAA